MIRLPRLFGPRHGPAVAARLRAWQRLPAVLPATPWKDCPLAVVDVETSGLDVRQDRLLSIGALRVDGGAISVGRGFHRYLRQTSFDSGGNVLIHRITHTQQGNGDPPGEVLLDFLEFLGTAPLVAFHAPFDQIFINRFLKKHLGVRMKNPLLDVAWLLPALFGGGQGAPLGLDDWMTRFGLNVPNRHSADEDALVTAQLFLIALSQAASRGLHTLGDLLEAAGNEQKIHNMHKNARH